MTNYNINKYVSEIEIEEGASIRCNCPSCRGVKTLSVSKVEGVLVYQCFKLSCEHRGAIPIGLTAQEIHDRIHNKIDTKEKVNLWTVPVYIKLNLNEAPRELISPFINRWNLHGTELWYDIKDKRAVFPIRRDGAVIGATGRALDGAIPKWYHYGITHYYTACQGEPNGVVVLVEDVISAITISSVCQNVTGMALLGTSLTHYHLEYIQDFTKIVVALDPDATKKNLQYKREIVAWTGIDTIALRLQKDPKEDNPEDIHNLRGAVT